jgi:hypothetical protein
MTQVMDEEAQRSLPELLPGSIAMIELTEHQQRAVDTQEQPPVVVDPQTGQEYLLIRRNVYEVVRGTLKPYGRGWDDPADDDLIRNDA